MIDFIACGLGEFHLLFAFGNDFLDGIGESEFVGFVKVKKIRTT